MNILSYFKAHIKAQQFLSQWNFPVQFFVTTFLVEFQNTFIYVISLSEASKYISAKSDDFVQKWTKSISDATKPGLGSNESS